MRILLMTGIAAGFGAVFGTPVTGAIFALEVLAIGRIRYDALLPCFIASILADIICTSWGITHTRYNISFVAGQANTFSFIPFDLMFLLKVVIAGIAFGLASFAFAELSHVIKDISNRFIKTKWLIPFIGGLIIIALTFLAGTTDYLWLGLTSKEPGGISIVNAFNENGVDSWSWLWKIVFTAVTLGMGFKGGEVTPLFFIGAALGNTLAVLLGAPVDLFAGLGFIAVFAGATNTPLACTLMGIELFGTTHVLYFGIACILAYYFSGHSGIYQSQLISYRKHLPFESEEELTLKQHKHKKRIQK
jgi:H+/Cl- antiporter ClcA